MDFIFFRMAATANGSIQVFYIDKKSVEPNHTLIVLIRFDKNLMKER